MSGISRPSSNNRMLSALAKETSKQRTWLLLCCLTIGGLWMQEIAPSYELLTPLRQEQQTALTSSTTTRSAVGDVDTTNGYRNIITGGGGGSDTSAAESIDSNGNTIDDDNADTEETIQRAESAIREDTPGGVSSDDGTDSSTTSASPEQEEEKQQQQQEQSPEVVKEDNPSSPILADTDDENDNNTITTATTTPPVNQFRTTNNSDFVMVGGIPQPLAPQKKTKPWCAHNKTMPCPSRCHPYETSVCALNHCRALGDTAEEQYPNRIVLHFTNGNRAGLLDRIIRLQYLMDLGAMLCATVELPPPHELLVPKHNTYANLSQNLTWNDFAEFTFLQENRLFNVSTSYTEGKLFPRRLETPMALTDINRTQIKPHLPNHANLSICSTPSSSSMNNPQCFYNDENGTEYIHDMYRILKRRKQQVRMLQSRNNNNNNTANNTPALESFVWNMRPDNFWTFLYFDLQPQLLKVLTHVPKVIVPHNKTVTIRRSSTVPIFTLRNVSCGTCGSYVRFDFPRRLIQTARQVLQEAIQMAGGSVDENNGSFAVPFGFFHIRRTDTVNSCDTSLERMRRFVQCSFRGPIAQQAAKDQTIPLVVFLATDESDPAYRRGILEILDEATPPVETNSSLSLSSNSSNFTSPGLQIRGIDLDGLILTVLKRQVDAGEYPETYINNYMIFWIGKILSRKSWFVLSQRKSFSCEDCGSKTVERALKNLDKQRKREGSPSLWEMEDTVGWKHLEFRDM